MSRIDRIFYAFIAVFSAIASLVLVYLPQSAGFAVKPVFWILIAMLAFEGIAFAIGRGAGGTVISPLARLIGLAGAFALISLAVWLAGLNVSLL